MLFEHIYYLDERFSGNFGQRDFGDAIPTMVDMPDYIDYDRVETYAHSKDLIMSYIFDKNNNICYYAQGNMDNILDDIQKVTPAMLPSIMKSHPSDLSSIWDYSGVEPMKPPIKNYTGTYHIPKEFNMDKFNPYGSFSGIRTSDDWTLN